MAYELPYPPPKFFLAITIANHPHPPPPGQKLPPHPQIFIFNMTPTIPPPLHFFQPHPQIFIFCNTPTTIPTFFLTLLLGVLGTKKNMAVGVINQGVGWGGGGGRTTQCTATVRHKLVAHKNSVRQLCAANLRRTLCASIVRDNCAPQTCGAHCVPVQCVATVRCKLAAHIVCQSSVQQLCVAYLRRTLWARTVRQKRNLHTKNAFAANLPQL